MKELIFKPNKEKLFQARQKRLERWNKLSKIRYTDEQEKERDQVELEINDAMKIFKERAMKAKTCEILRK